MASHWFRELLNKISLRLQPLSKRAESTIEPSQRCGVYFGDDADNHASPHGSRWTRPGTNDVQQLASLKVGACRGSGEKLCCRLAIIAKTWRGPGSRAGTRRRESQAGLKQQCWLGVCSQPFRHDGAARHAAFGKLLRRPLGGTGVGTTASGAPCLPSAGTVAQVTSLLLLCADRHE